MRKTQSSGSLVAGPLRLWSYVAVSLSSAGALVVSCSFSFASEQLVINSESVYAKIDALDCGNKTIVLTSNCIESSKKGGEPFCFSQDLSFVSKDRNDTKSLLYNHKPRSDGLNFIVQISCLMSRDQLILMSTNFANCRTCEWFDVYSLGGEYQGSIGDPGRDLPVAYKTFLSDQNSLLSKLSDAPAVEIDRNR